MKMRWPRETTVINEQPKSIPSLYLKCIACFGQAEMFYSGSSYCASCLNEKLRTGGI